MDLYIHVPDFLPHFAKRSLMHLMEWANIYGFAFLFSLVQVIDVTPRGMDSYKCSCFLL